LKRLLELEALPPEGLMFVSWLYSYYTYATFGNSIQLPGAYTPYTKKLYFGMSKIFDNFFLHVHLHSICVFVKFREEPILWSMQKRENLSFEKPYF
jgi:hypothetical protein